MLYTMVMKVITQYHAHKNITKYMQIGNLVRTNLYVSSSLPLVRMEYAFA